MLCFLVQGCLWSEKDAICGHGVKGVKISFGDRYLDSFVVNIEKNGNILDVMDCYSLLYYQRRTEKKSVVSIYMNLKLREVS